LTGVRPLKFGRFFFPFRSFFSPHRSLTFGVSAQHSFFSPTRCPPDRIWWRTPSFVTRAFFPSGHPSPGHRTRSRKQKTLIGFRALHTSVVIPLTPTLAQVWHHRRGQAPLHLDTSPPPPLGTQGFFYSLSGGRAARRLFSFLRCLVDHRSPPLMESSPPPPFSAVVHHREEFPSSFIMKRAVPFSPLCSQSPPPFAFEIMFFGLKLPCSPHGNVYGLISESLLFPNLTIPPPNCARSSFLTRFFFIGIENYTVWVSPADYFCLFPPTLFSLIPLPMGSSLDFFPG